MILDKVNYPEDLKCLKDDEKVTLAEEIREKIIDTVSFLPLQCPFRQTFPNLHRQVLRHHKILLS